MKALRTIFKAGAALALITSLHAGGEGWTSDFTAAKAQASKEGKDLLIDFTGSDWCGWCIKLNKEVFVHDAFKEGVKDKFVLVELDFPRDKTKIDAATLEQNKELGKTYGVRGYPTILLTDNQGRPYAKTGYRRGGPEAYVTHLDELQATRIKRDEGFAAAAKVEGVEKAKALVAALQALNIPESQVGEFYGEVIEQIKAADPEDAAGYLKGIEQKKRMAEFGKKVNELAQNKDMEGALKLVDDTMAAETFDAEMTQRMFMTKAMIYARMSRFDDSIAHMDKALAANPQGENNEGIKGMRQQIETAKQKATAAEEAKKKAADEVKPEAAEAPKAEAAHPPKAEAAHPPKAEAAEAPKEPIRARDK